MTRLRLSPLPLALLVCIAGAASARAAECPETIPENTAERRAAAKEHFTLAESAERSGDDVGAVRAYQCSMKLVAHAFTAYNLARLAEKTGDLELSLSSYRHYLTLKVDAADRAEVEGRIARLEARIAAVRETGAAPAQPGGAQDPLASSPALEPAVAGPVPEAPVDLAQEAAPHAPAGEPALLGPAEWVVAGVGAAALVAGVVLNVGARSKMSDCRSLAKEGKVGAAQDACDAAKPQAYASYVLFGAAAAAAIVDVALIWRRSSRSETIAVTPLPGGALASYAARF